MAHEVLQDEPLHMPSIASPVSRWDLGIIAGRVAETSKQAERIDSFTTQALPAGIGPCSSLCSSHCWGLQPPASAVASSERAEPGQPALHHRHRLPASRPHAAAFWPALVEVPPLSESADAEEVSEALSAMTISCWACAAAPLATPLGLHFVGSCLSFRGEPPVTTAPHDQAWL